MKVRTAIFPVAGLGTRFLPATKTVPKEMLPLVDLLSVQRKMTLTLYQLLHQKLLDRIESLWISSILLIA